MDATTLTSPGPAERSPATPPDVVVDARPILRRTEHNPWDRTEQVRSRLYRLVEATCHKLGFEALVLESDPYVHPAWVKVESWKPACNGALTMRSAMTVTIAAVPYHRYENLYSVKWEKLGRCGSVDHLYAFGEREIRQMMHFLWAARPLGSWVTRWNQFYPRCNSGPRGGSSGDLETSRPHYERIGFRLEPDGSS